MADPRKDAELCRLLYVLEQHEKRRALADFMAGETGRPPETVNFGPGPPTSLTFEGLMEQARKFDAIGERKRHELHVRAFEDLPIPDGLLSRRDGPPLEPSHFSSIAGIPVLIRPYMPAGFAVMVDAGAVDRSMETGEPLPAGTIQVFDLRIKEPEPDA